MRQTTRAGYLAIEKRLQQFADEIGIDMDHLDLLLWSRKTGEILKQQVLLTGRRVKVYPLLPL